MKAIGYIVTLVFLCAVSVIYSGYVFSCLWEWFIVSTFGFDVLTVTQAIGVSLAINYATQKTEKPEDDNDKSTHEKVNDLLFTMLFKPTVALFFGFILLQFM